MQPLSSPEEVPDPGIEPRSPALSADSSPSEPPGKPNVYWAAFCVHFGVTPSVARNDHILKYDMPLCKVALGKSAVSALTCSILNLASYQEDRIPFSPLLRLEAFIAEGQRWIIFLLTLIRKNA